MPEDFVQLKQKVDNLQKSMEDIIGPIRDTLDRVKTGLIGDETGDHTGLISRVLLAEAQIQGLKAAIEDLKDWTDSSDIRLDNIERTEPKMHADLQTIRSDVQSLRDGLDAVKNARAWWYKLIIGGIVSGAIGLLWYLVQNWIAK